MVEKKKFLIENLPYNLLQQTFSYVIIRYRDAQNVEAKIQRDLEDI